MNIPQDTTRQRTGAKWHAQFIEPECVQRLIIEDGTGERKGVLMTAIVSEQFPQPDTIAPYRSQVEHVHRLALIALNAIECARLAIRIERERTK